MSNKAIIKLEIEQCKECPYCYRSDDGVKYVCRHHDVANGATEVGNGDDVPDFCPFILKRLQTVYDQMSSGLNTTRPKKFITQIEKKAEDSPNAKFGADHGFGHIRRVTTRGLDIIDQLVNFGYIKPEAVAREKLLLKIAAYLHDIGLADQLSNHASHSAELAKKYLSDKAVDIDAEDLELIYHAINNHSSGVDTETVTDAVLLLADKLDTTSVRIKRVMDELTREQTKIMTAEFRLYREISTGKARGAELRYDTKDNFNVDIFMEAWPKAILIPRMVALDYLKLSWFKFIVNDEEVNIVNILYPR
ncbi:HD domain-containing protein [Candidatus Saccharibacteria bacterium]|nr:HD domain-containing protein [Candidatus Saccharibacteria bacterium]